MRTIEHNGPRRLFKSSLPSFKFFNPCFWKKNLKFAEQKSKQELSEDNKVRRRQPNLSSNYQLVYGKNKVSFCLQMMPLLTTPGEGQ